MLLTMQMNFWGRNYNWILWRLNIKELLDECLLAEAATLEVYAGIMVVGTLFCFSVLLDFSQLTDLFIIIDNNAVFTGDFGISLL